MRFLLDMGVDVRAGNWLSEQGHDSLHLRDEGLQRLPNGEIFKKAIAERRVILTFDLDFGEIAALARGTKASVIVFRLRNTRRERVVERLASVLAECSSALEKGAVIAVEATRHRVRQLPVGH
jgi:predicted nuclease of predicted toxin-antitoxin system